MPQPSASLRIVLVEDNAADSHWFQLVLEEMQVDTTLDIYPSAIAALAEFSKREPPDVIVSDWFLPVLNFPEFRSELRNIPGYRDVPIAVFASYDRFRLEPGHLDVYCCLTKPITAEQLQTIISLGKTPSLSEAVPQHA